jgi:hypothetical protein
MSSTEPEYKECPRCKGTGIEDQWAVDEQDCLECYGDGEIVIQPAIVNSILNVSSQ